MPKTPDFAIGCEATAKGKVRLFFIRDGKAEEGVELPLEAIAGLVTTLLIAATKATELSGQKPGATRRVRSNIPVISPTAIGLSGGKASAPMSLIVHAGQVRLGIALPPAAALRELGEKLIAASASETRSN